MKISELYNKHDRIILTHGVSKNGPESRVPKNIKLADQIKFSIAKSKTCKLSTSSFVFCKNASEKQLFTRLGIIIKEGEILGQFKEDSGLTCETLHLINSRLMDNIDEVLFFNSPNYNEIILKDVEIFGIYINALQPDYDWIEIRNASSELNLPVYFLNVCGLLSTQWNEVSKQYNCVNSEFLKIKDIANSTI